MENVPTFMYACDLFQARPEVVDDFLGREKTPDPLVCPDSMAFRPGSVPPDYGLLFLH